MDVLSFRINETDHYFSLYDNNTDTSVLAHKNKFTVILGIIFGLGMFLNSVSIVSIIKTKKLEPITILILNLILADIIYIAGI